jgi:N-acetylglucosamine-6-phosphate deacetylase
VIPEATLTTSSPPLRIRGRHYATAQLVDIVCSGGLIEGITSTSPALNAPADLCADWLAPGLFDLQINGCEGRDFSSARLTVEDVRRVVYILQQHGITGFCPTLITSSRATLLHGFDILHRACSEGADVARAIPCLHLEGPYISPEDGPRGAHPREYVRKPDWDELSRFQDAAGGRIRLVTVAPEHEGAMAFIEKAVAAGLVVALGHTAASSSCIREAVRAGARLSTHLGNGSHAYLPRHDNYLWEQLACDELWASLIADGHHLPPAFLRCILRVKTPARTILTCDASPLAGLPPGRYREWGQEVDVLPSGKIVVPGTTYLAGSGVLTDRCVRHAMEIAGVSLLEAVDMASARPRQLLGLEPRPLAAGAPADLVVFDSQPDGTLAHTRTVIAGHCLPAPEPNTPLPTGERGEGFGSPPKPPHPQTLSPKGRGETSEPGS